MSTSSASLVPGTLRLLCTDFDGTIAEPDAQPIFPGFFERLEAWRKRNPVYWIINTGRTFESLQEELELRAVPFWPDWVVTVEREIWLIRGKRGIGWFEWNRKCELLHNQLFESVKPVWRHIDDFIGRHTAAQLVEDSGSPRGIIASHEEEADEISAFLEPLLKSWPMLTAVRNSIYFRFSHRNYNKGICLEAIAEGLGVSPNQTLVAGDHLNDLSMLERRCARYLVCPSNAVAAVKAKVSAGHGYVAGQAVAQGLVEAWDHLLPLPVESAA